MHSPTVLIIDMSHRKSRLCENIMVAIGGDNVVILSIVRGRILAIVIASGLVLPALPVAADFSFQYDIRVSMQATVHAVGIEFVGAEFTPYEGTPYGRVDLGINSTGACNMRLFGVQGYNWVPVFDTGPLRAGYVPLYVNEVSRGYRQRFMIVAFNCYGQPIAKDLIEFWTPAPNIVTIEQWERVTVERRTVQVGYR